MNIVFLDAGTNEVLGAVPIPDCFSPNAAFEKDAARVGLQGLILTDDDFMPLLDAVAEAGGTAEELFINGVVLMQSMRAAKASLN